MKIERRKIMAFLFVALCVNSYSKNLDTPSIYDSAKMKISDWKLNETEKDLNKDGSLDKLLVYYKSTDSKISVEYVPYLNDGTNKYIKVKPTQKDFNVATFAADYKLYTSDYVEKFNQNLPKKAVKPQTQTDDNMVEIAVEEQKLETIDQVPTQTTDKLEEAVTTEVTTNEKVEEQAKTISGSYEYIEYFETPRPKELTFNYKYIKNGPVDMDNFVFVSSPTAKIRSTPSVNGAILKEAKYTEKYKVIGKVKSLDPTSKLNWYEIMYNGKLAYIADTLVKKREFDWNTLVTRVETTNAFITKTLAAGEKIYYLDDYVALAGTSTVTKDKFGNRESQSERVYTAPDFKSYIFLPDRSIVRILEQTDKYVKFESPVYGIYYLKNDRKKLLKVSNIEAEISKFVFVDRSSQNEMVVERNADMKTWNVVTVSYVTTGKDGGKAVVTPFGDFLIAYGKPVMQYTSDIDPSKVVGDASFAVRFSGGGYLHGIPSMFEPAGNRAARKAATARKLGTYPESHKCVRHLDDQIKFIYNWLGNSTPGSKTGYRVPEVPAMVIVK